MWQGKNKALTFSFDDGVQQDKRTIEILNEYGLKATFNLNSFYIGKEQKTLFGDRLIDYSRVMPEEMPSVYAGHEVAVHTVHHYRLTELSEQEIVREVEEDRKALEKLIGYDVCGMAYPCGGVNNDERVAEIIGRATSMKYARTITSTHDFEPQENLMRFNPSVYFTDKAKLFELAEKFISLKPDREQIFYIWGHTYELDQGDKITWKNFEEFCKLIAGKEDIFYGTNREILLKK